MDGWLRIGAVRYPASLRKNEGAGIAVRLYTSGSRNSAIQVAARVPGDLASIHQKTFDA